jgi:hypothetical protein
MMLTESNFRFPIPMDFNRRRSYRYLYAIGVKGDLAQAFVDNKIESSKQHQHQHQLGMMPFVIPGLGK